MRCVRVKIPSRCPPPLAQRLKAVTSRLIIQLSGLCTILGAATVGTAHHRRGRRFHYFRARRGLRAQTIAFRAVSVIVNRAARHG